MEQGQVLRSSRRARRTPRETSPRTPRRRLAPSESSARSAALSRSDRGCTSRAQVSRLGEKSSSANRDDVPPSRAITHGRAFREARRSSPDFLRERRRQTSSRSNSSSERKRRSASSNGRSFVSGFGIATQKMPARFAARMPVRRIFERDRLVGRTAEPLERQQIQGGIGLHGAHVVARAYGVELVQRARTSEDCELPISASSSTRSPASTRAVSPTRYMSQCREAAAASCISSSHRVLQARSRSARSNVRPDCSSRYACRSNPPIVPMHAEYLSNGSEQPCDGIHFGPCLEARGSRCRRSNRRNRISVLRCV